MTLSNPRLTTKLVVLVLLIWSGAPPVAAALSQRAFPLGKAGLVETRTSERLADGVTLHIVTRGTPMHLSPWVVTAGVARTTGERKRLTVCLAAAGLVGHGERYETPGRWPKPYFEIVSSAYPTEESALVASRTSTRCKLRTRAVAASPYQAAGPWRINIVEIDPLRFKGRLQSASGSDSVVGRTTTTDIARRLGAIVAVNAGFFAMTAAEGVVGEPAGISVVAGQIRSEPTLGRPYLLLNDGARVSARILSKTPRPASIVWRDGTVTRLGGVNRQPGEVRDCGTTGRNRLPIHDKTCRKGDDFVAITPGAGIKPRTEGAVVAVLTSDGRLARPGPADQDHTILVATGRMAEMLRARLADGERARLDLEFHGQDGLPTGGSLFAVNGAPSLLRGGHMVRRDDVEGWATVGVSAGRLGYVHRWSVLRNPRTAVGIDGAGHIWLVVVDGREFAEDISTTTSASVGLSIEELRRVMRHLGARDAINLDGGGSSAMVVRGHLITHPSDSTGERAVGDAIVVVPRSSGESSTTSNQR